ncbi:hypothetical protein ASE21_13805 [Flavobacterium sp. Root901]|nr:hypothetical protein ASE21_13805 [Flavobacterium sp. Root901]
MAVSAMLVFIFWKAIIVFYFLSAQSAKSARVNFLPQIKQILEIFLFFFATDYTDFHRLKIKKKSIKSV